MALIDAEEKPFELDRLRGKAVVVSFIYTTCNGSCPATTHNLYRVQQALKDAGLWGRQVEFVSISLDPARHARGPASLRQVYGADPAAWHFLTGPPDRVSRVITSWGMWAKSALPACSTIPRASS